MSSLADIEESMAASTCESKINRSQLVGDQNGEVVVPMYAWDTFLGGYFKKVTGILELHHLIYRFSNQDIRVVFHKVFEDSEKQFGHDVREKSSQ